MASFNDHSWDNSDKSIWRRSCISFLKIANFISNEVGFRGGGGGGVDFWSSRVAGSPDGAGVVRSSPELATGWVWPAGAAAEADAVVDDDVDVFDDGDAGTLEWWLLPLEREHEDAFELDDDRFIEYDDSFLSADSHSRLASLRLFGNGGSPLNEDEDVIGE